MITQHSPYMTALEAGRVAIIVNRNGAAAYFSAYLLGSQDDETIAVQRIMDESGALSDFIHNTQLSTLAGRVIAIFSISEGGDAALMRGHVHATAIDIELEFYRRMSSHAIEVVTSLMQYQEHDK